MTRIESGLMWQRERRALVRPVATTAFWQAFLVFPSVSSAQSAVLPVSSRRSLEDFLLGRGDTARVLVRAIGPSLTNSGVPNALSDPTLALHDGNGTLLAFNDNWRTDHEAEIIATTIPPTNDLESAILLDLSPGAYTAIVQGHLDLTGVALVEAYQLQ